MVKLHETLCHPGVSRFSHFVRSRNLPYSVEDIKNVISSCSVCCELKPRYFKPPNMHLIKATVPFERLNIDFKGPLPSVSNNLYILTVIDEYSRFPFAFACPNTNADTVIKCLCQLFSIFGFPNYVHSDRGSSFMSQELKSFLTEKGIAQSRTTPYNPEGNSQCERYNGIIWKAVQLSLRSRNLQTSQWELVLPDALHSLRSLLSTSTNVTPHERIFTFNRRSTSGSTLPTWLIGPGKVLYKRQVRHSKHDPLVDEVDLLESNPQYAHIRFPSGRESTVSTKHLAPTGSVSLLNTENGDEDKMPVLSDGCVSDVNKSTDEISLENHNEATVAPQVEAGTPPSAPRRSSRIRKAPDRLNYS